MNTSRKSPRTNTAQGQENKLHNYLLSSNISNVNGLLELLACLHARRTRQRALCQQSAEEFEEFAFFEGLPLARAQALQRQRGREQRLQRTERLLAAVKCAISALPTNNEGYGPEINAQVLRELDALTVQLVPVVERLRNIVPDLWRQFERIHNRQRYLTHALRHAR